MSTQFTEPPEHPKPTETAISAEPLAAKPGPGSGQITVSYTNTLRDSLVFNWYLTFHSRVGWMLILGLLIVIFPLIYLTIPPGTSDSQKLLTSGVVLLIVFMIAALVAIPLGIALVWLIWICDKTRGAKVTIALFQDSINLETPFASSQNKWTLIRKLRKTPRFIMLSAQLGTAVLVPRRAFVCQEDFDEFYQWCADRVDASALPASPGSSWSARGVRWLTTSFMGTTCLAILGGFLVAMGGFGIADTLNGPDAPTRLTINELERSKDPPPSRYLEITGGHLFWPELYQDAVGTRLSRETTTIAYYVPLVSPEVVNEWKFAPAHARLPYDKARVFLRISPDDMRRDFPHEVDSRMATVLSEAKSPVIGRVSHFKEVPKHMRQGMMVGVTEQEADRMILLEYGDEVPSKPLWIGVGFAIVGLGVLGFTPLGLKVFGRGARPVRA
ncbi:MAG TPA: YcxB family protein [Gemmataceae bacterium]|nr:YcxB family protein [Gemmataceae bacterium]